MDTHRWIRSGVNGLTNLIIDGGKGEGWGAGGEGTVVQLVEYLVQGS